MTNCRSVDNNLADSFLPAEADPLILVRLNPSKVPPKTDTATKRPDARKQCGMSCLPSFFILEKSYRGPWINPTASNLNISREYFFEFILHWDKHQSSKLSHCELGQTHRQYSDYGRHPQEPPLTCQNAPFQKQKLPICPVNPSFSCNQRLTKNRNRGNVKISQW